MTWANIDGTRYEISDEGVVRHEHTLKRVYPMSDNKRISLKGRPYVISALMLKYFPPSLPEGQWRIVPNTDRRYSVSKDGRLWWNIHYVYRSNGSKQLIGGKLIKPKFKDKYCLTFPDGVRRVIHINKLLEVFNERVL